MTKKVIFRHTGDVDKETKSFRMIMFRSRERNRNVFIGNSPVIVSDNEYKILKNGKHGKDIVLVTSRTRLSKPLEIDISKSKDKEKDKPKVKEKKKSKVKVKKKSKYKKRWYLWVVEDMV